MIYDLTLTFPCSREEGEKLVRRLREGITDEDFLKLISSISTVEGMKSEKVLEDWIRAGKDAGR